MGESQKDSAEVAGHFLSLSAGYFPSPRPQKGNLLGFGLLLQSFEWA